MFHSHRIVFASGLLSALALGSLVPASPVLAQACSLKRIASLDMIPQSDGRVAVLSTINGQNENLLIDTGGITSSLSPASVKALDLSPHQSRGEATAFNVAGKKMDQVALVTSFALGDVKGDDFTFLVDAGSPGEELAGTLAPDILQDWDIDFDFAANKFNLFAQDHCEGKVVYWTTSYAELPVTLNREGQMTARVTIDGNTLDAVIDTGSDETAMSSGIAERVFNVDDHTPGIEHYPGAKPDDLIQYRYRFKTMSLSGVTINNPLVDLLPDIAQDKMTADMGKLANDPIYGPQINIPRVIIGMNVLRHLHMYVAYKEKKIYLSAAAPAAGH